MSKQEIQYEINKVLDQFSDKALSDLLNFLKKLEVKQPFTLFNSESLDKILNEDKELLEKLAR
jgi:hypothetical protein